MTSTRTANLHLVGVFPSFSWSGSCLCSVGGTWKSFGSVGRCSGQHTDNTCSQGPNAILAIFDP
ncbi:hypothetical protein BDN72DRAFT_844801 [Pluteus cervinus]|uniref:Uncharacterized protein n=1 Tax=Pluteus cervinus TaxID=181527 RepID=A0ACD3AK32_9AGAR|nr:hypothetical protein BDN72DRAFT_844801 [Pluteus cervinus]